MRNTVKVSPTAHRLLSETLLAAAGPSFAAVQVTVDMEEVYKNDKISSKSNGTDVHSNVDLSSTAYRMRAYTVMDRNYEVPLSRRAFLFSLRRMRTVHGNWSLTLLTNHLSIFSCTVKDRPTYELPVYRLSNIRTVGDRAAIELMWYTEFSVYGKEAVSWRLSVWQPQSQKLICASVHRARIVETS